MEFNEKLQYLRKEKGLTQEELAAKLYVSRTAVSKWESGKGYPNIDTLKEIAKFFTVTVDALLSSDELLTLAEEDNRQKERNIRDLVFGLLDCSVAMLFFLPFFGQRFGGIVQEVSLLNLTEIAVYLRILYLISIAGIVGCGILTLALQKCGCAFWINVKYKISLVLSTVGALLFMISQQPYGAVLLFVFLAIKALTIIKWQ